MQGLKKNFIQKNVTINDVVTFKYKERDPIIGINIEKLIIKDSYKDLHPLLAIQKNVFSFYQYLNISYLETQLI